MLAQTQLIHPSDDRRDEHRFQTAEPSCSQTFQADVRRAFTLSDTAWLAAANSPSAATRLYFGLAVFHGLLRQMRRRSVLLRRDDFCTTDLRCAAAVLRRALEADAEVIAITALFSA